MLVHCLAESFRSEVFFWRAVTNLSSFLFLICSFHRQLRGSCPQPCCVAWWNWQNWSQSLAWWCYIGSSWTSWPRTKHPILWSLSWCHDMSCETQQNDHAPQQTIQKNIFWITECVFYCNCEQPKQHTTRITRLNGDNSCPRLLSKFKDWHCKKTFDPGQLKRHAFKQRMLCLRKVLCFTWFGVTLVKQAWGSWSANWKPFVDLFVWKYWKLVSFLFLLSFLRGNPHKICLAGETKTRHINKSFVENGLGPPIPEEDLKTRLQIPGVAVGLVWTEVGRKTMVVESSLMKGSGKLIRTRQLGDVIKESAAIAVSCVLCLSFEFFQFVFCWLVWFAGFMDSDTSASFGLVTSPSFDRNRAEPANTATTVSHRIQYWPPLFASPCLLEHSHQHTTSVTSSVGIVTNQGMFDKFDLHIHFPAGAVSNDGPSAGVTLVSVITSLLTRTWLIPETALTGEFCCVTNHTNNKAIKFLSSKHAGEGWHCGAVLPVGGIKEKVLAATQQTSKGILPSKNRNNLIKVDTIEEVLSAVFENTVDVIGRSLIDFFFLCCWPTQCPARFCCCDLDFFSRSTTKKHMMTAYCLVLLRGVSFWSKNKKQQFWSDQFSFFDEKNCK